MDAIPRMLSAIYLRIAIHTEVQLLESSQTIALTLNFPLYVTSKLHTYQNVALVPGHEVPPLVRTTNLQWTKEVPGQHS